MCICYLSKEKRVCGKAPGQLRSFRGVIIGYVHDMSAYKVWDVDAKKRRDVSYSFTVVQEGFFPFKDKKAWPVEAEGSPVRFYPTREALLDEKEWEFFDFDAEEEEEVLGNTQLFKITLSRSGSDYPAHLPLLPRVILGDEKGASPREALPIHMGKGGGGQGKKGGEKDVVRLHAPLPPPLPKPPVGHPPLQVRGGGMPTSGGEIPIKSPSKVARFWSKQLAISRDDGSGEDRKHSTPVQVPFPAPEVLPIDWDKGKRRSTRISVPPNRLIYVAEAKMDKPPGIPPPKTLGEAKKSAWWDGYAAAIEEEVSNLVKLGCWEVISIKSIPRGTNILRSKFVFDDKRGPDGKLMRFKARMVAMVAIFYKVLTTVLRDYYSVPRASAPQ